ncbi:MAG: hypothetical protein GY820_05485 [Gammaproteobacteria bacterium]|nr:hypothetical protein [Gammaproteobacteria bacterium]
MATKIRERPVTAGYKKFLDGRLRLRLQKSSTVTVTVKIFVTVSFPGVDSGAAKIFGRIFLYPIGIPKRVKFTKF